MTDSSKTANARYHQSQIYLTGYRGSGKTSVAKILGIEIKRSVVDLDAEIVSMAGRPIKKIFHESGEEAFRDLETQSLIAASAKPPAIISLGGGAILRTQNRTLIAKSGICIWLDADPKIIVERLIQDDATASQRPGLTDLPMAKEVKKLMAQRRPLYDSISNFRVDTGEMKIAEVAEQIANWLTLPNKG